MSTVSWRIHRVCRQAGGADVLKEKFNVELNIIPDADGVYQTRAQNGNPW